MILDIVEPTPECKLPFHVVVPGSVIVKIEKNGLTAFYYEGGIYTRKNNRVPTKEERDEYAKIAASRAAHSYPTVARFFASADEVNNIKVIGHVNTDTWDVTWHPSKE